MKVLFAGGGTGGHLYPAIAMAAELLRLEGGAAIAFAGTAAGIEAREVPRLGYRLHLFPVRGFRRGLSSGAIVANIGVLGDFAASVLKAFRLVLQEKPDVVVGTGGFVSAPLLLAAQLLGKKTLIQEQNAFPGVSTKLLSLLATEVHLSFEEARAHLPRSSRVHVSGNPARHFELPRRGEARRAFGLDPQRPTLLVFGGSRGARSINNALLASLGGITAVANLIWQTGQLDFERLSREVAPREGLWIGPYIEDMASAYGAADLVLCRAGASSLAELSNLGMPSVLVPYPHATGDHQRHNAAAFVSAGAAIMIDDRELASREALGTALGLLTESARLEAMGAAAASIAFPDAASMLAARIAALAQH